MKGHFTSVQIMYLDLFGLSNYVIRGLESIVIPFCQITDEKTEVFENDFCH